MKTAVSLAGIKERSDGTREVPASERSDGTVRAPIRIRPGYVPAADKPKYRPPRSRGPTRMDEHGTSTEKDSVMTLSEPHRPYTVASPDLADKHNMKEDTVHDKSASVKRSAMTQKTAVGEEPGNRKSNTKETLAPRVTAKERLTAWSNSGWHGGEDIPSRYAKISTKDQQTDGISTSNAKRSENKEDSGKKSRPPRPRSNKKNNRHSSAEQVEDGVDEEFLMLEAELNKMKLHG